jgi:stage V sporulation protein B
MVLGVTAVPALSNAFENGYEKFSSLLTSIFKYTVILSTFGAVAIALFYNDLLSLFYGNSNSDIVNNAGKILFVLAITSLPCAVASTSVYCAQSLGYAKATIAPFVVSAVVRVIINFVLIPIDSINVLGSAVSNFVGFSIIFIWNMATIKRRTKVKFNTLEIFIKPIICAVLTYFVVSGVSQSITVPLGTTLSFLLCSLICILAFVTLLVLMNCLSFDEIKSIKN